MLSLQQAIEIKESIRSYLQATFTFRKKRVAQAFDEFIIHPTQGMFKGPYVSLKLRFVKAAEDDIPKIPLDIKPSFPPYDHQIKSWERLSTHHKEPQPTIVTTGTGSGKTEAFLFPILDYCYRQQHRPGIKVIIMYPMNALATDQAKRLAEAIWEDDRLQGKIRAGLFIGEGNGAKGQFPKTMGKEHIIEHRDTILDAPPDILLTNFKMLDYALMKHNFQKIWNHNLSDNTLFRFLVLDELHTYDGAQGSDVANLIRRLKLKLQMEPGQLCPVGTSATIGSGAEAPQLLSDYASKVFGEEIRTDSIITENRISAEQFFDKDEELNDFIPSVEDLRKLEFQENENLEAYTKTIATAWGLDSDSLAKGLMNLRMLKDLVEIINLGSGVKTPEEIIHLLSNKNRAYRDLPQWDEEGQFNPKERILESLLGLVAEARDIDNPKSPFIYLQVQLWIRELSGVQYTVEEQARFSFRDQVDARQEVAALPPWYCRECNSSGWLGVKREDGDDFSKDINDIYQKYFDRHKNVYYLLPEKELSIADFQSSGYHPDDFLEVKLDPVSLRKIGANKEGIRLQALRNLKENKIEEICPCCNSSGTIAIIGTKIPTLSSIAVSQTLATDLDIADEQNRKVLAFTNSVQDAAHQAGFIESRNYRFTFRASLQKVINELNRPVSLELLADEFIYYWKANADESGEHALDAYLYRFFPKDYLGKASPRDYKIGDAYTTHFLKEFDQRIRWEVYSEFGFNARIGRTLEKTGASSVSFDPLLLSSLWDKMEQWLSDNDVGGIINKEALNRFTNLILHRIRIRGAVDHLYLNKYRTERLSIWDLNWMKDSRHFLNPRYNPNKSRFPKLLTDGSSRDNLLDTVHAKNSNWFHSYFRKSFPQKLEGDIMEMGGGVTTDFINEFYVEWLDALVELNIINEVKVDGQRTFCIEPSAIRVEKDVFEFSCTGCEDKIYSHDDLEWVEKGSCLSYRCNGHYEPSEQTAKNYYNVVYNRNRSPRIYAREHTGLLERRVRERLEVDFKK